MKKPVVRWTSCLLAVLVMLSSTAWASTEDVDQEEQTVAGAAYSSGLPEDPNFAERWNTAAQNGGTVQLEGNVTADENGSFGSGEGFDDNGAIKVPTGNPVGKSITLKLNGYTIDRGLTTPRENGYVILVEERASLTIIDGPTPGGSITGGYNASPDSGGGITVKDAGALRVESGRITGNKTTQNGGGVFVSDIGSFDFLGGQITDNTAQGSGGGIYGTQESQVTLKGSITGNHSGANGGGVASFGYVQMIGGQITCNQAAQEGGGVYYSYPSIALTFSNEPIITGNTKGNESAPAASNVYLAGTSTIAFNNPLTSSASIGIDGEFTGGAAERPITKNSTHTGDAGNRQYLSADDSGKSLVYDSDSNTIKLVKGAAPSESHSHALNVGLTGVTAGSEKVTFDKKLTSANGALCVDGTDRPADQITLTNATAVDCYKLSAGSYCLDSDIEINRTIVPEGAVNLCLNGHEIRQTITGNRVFLVPEEVTLNICDCDSSRPHTIEHDGQSVTIQGGLITGGNLPVNLYLSGGGIYNLGTLNLYKGTVAGNQTAYGGGISNGGVFHMYGATVSYNEAERCGGISHGGEDMTISGGVVESNTADVCGGIFVGAAAAISNCTISRNSTPSEKYGEGFGGGLLFQNDAEATIENCTIEGNYAGLQGGGIHLYNGSSGITLIGSRITGNTVGTSDEANGAGIYNHSSVRVSGSTIIWGNTKAGQENNVYFPAYDGDSKGHISYAQNALTDGAKIGITTGKEPTSENGVQFTWRTGLNDVIDETFSQYFFADDSSQYHVSWVKNENNHYLDYLALCVGGTTQHEHGNTVFEKFPDSYTTPFSGVNYYLTKNLALGTYIDIADTVNLCLNGYRITGASGRPAFLVKNGATLNLYTEADNFAGLSGSGGVQVEGGGTLNLYKQDGTVLKTYSPAAGSAGGTVTVESSGTVTIPGEGGGPTTPDDHPTRHPAFASATELNEGNFLDKTSSSKPSGYTGALPEKQSAYRFLEPSGKYYLKGDFKMPYALIVVPGAGGAATDFCLNGSNLGADNDTWLYEMQHVFWVPEQTTLNVVDCQRDLHIVWLYGGRVFLKNGGKVNISGKLPDYITTIEMTDGDGEVRFERKDGQPVMSLPQGAVLTQKLPGGKTQVIANTDGVLTMTSDGKITTVTPPGGGSVGLKLPEAVSGEAPPAIALEAPAGSTVKTGADGPQITLKQPGEVADDGTVTSQAVTVTTVDPTGKTVEVTVAAPSGKTVEVDAAGAVKVPEGSTVSAGDVTVKVDTIGGSGGAATVSPGGQITLPAGSQATASNPKKGSATIVIALPGDGGGGTIGVTETGVKPPESSSVEAKKGSVTIVIALPYPGGTELEIEFGEGGTLVLPPDTTVKKDGGPEQTVTADKPVLDPGTGELMEEEPSKPVNPGPDNPNPPSGTTTEITETPVTKGDVTVEKKEDGTITVTPARPGGDTEPVVIRPLPQEPGTTPAAPVVDDSGKVFPNTPFTVEPKGEDGPTVTASEDGSVAPDGTVTANTVTVEQPENPSKKITLTAPEDDAVKVNPDGGAQVPVGTEVEQNGVKVTVDNVPNPNTPVPVKPDGALDLPGGSVITVTPEPKPGDSEQTYKATLPDGGGEVKPGPGGKITLPENTKVRKPDGTEITITAPGGTLDLVTGEITSGRPSGGNKPGGSSSGGGGSSGGEGYVIQADAGRGGTIRPSGRTWVAVGASKTFVIAPQTGYDVEEVLVDGVSVGAVTSYTFQNVRRNHTIQASFTASGSPGLLNTEDHMDYLHGFKDGFFRPDESMTRAQAAQMFYNLLRDRDVQGKSAFTDVPEEMWCYEAVSALKALDIMLGVTEERFEPDRPITRAELVVTAVRFTEHRRGTVSFTDVAETDWYCPEISAAATRGWIGGYKDGTFRPNSPITRAQTAAVINRLLGRQADEDFLERHPTGLQDFPDASPGYWAYEDVMEAANAHNYRIQSGGERWTALR